RSRRLTVIAMDRRAEGTATGVMSRAGVRDDQIGEVVAAAERAATAGGPAEDAGPLITAAEAPGTRDWDSAPAETSIRVFERFAPALGEAFAAAQSADRLLYGFASHELTSVFLGTSAGLRLRADLPTGK